MNKAKKQMILDEEFASGRPCDFLLTAPMDDDDDDDDD